MFRAWPLVVLTALLGGCKAAKLAQLEEGRQLRREPSGAGGSPVIVVGIDGIDRSLLYALLQGGSLPGLAALLGDGRHVYLDEDLISVLPSSSIPAWASLWTGEPPAENGAPGNEVWIRERRELAALAPATFDPSASMFELYAGEYGDSVLEVPTLWERLRAGIKPMYPMEDHVVMLSHLYGELIAERSPARAG